MNVGCFDDVLSSMYSCLGFIVQKLEVFGHNVNQKLEVFGVTVVLKWICLGITVVQKLDMFGVYGCPEVQRLEVFEGYCCPDIGGVGSVRGLLFCKSWRCLGVYYPDIGGVWGFIGQKLEVLGSLLPGFWGLRCPDIGVVWGLLLSRS